MPKLVVFDIEELRGLRGLDRYTALERYRSWRSSERANDRRELQCLRTRLYRFLNPLARLKSVETQKRKIKIVRWFVFCDRYVKGEGNNMENVEMLKQRVLVALENSQKKDRFCIAVEIKSSLSRTYNALKLLEAEGVVKSERLGKQILWHKV